MLSLSIAKLAHVFQYRQVLLRWRAGEMHRKRAPFDWLFQRAGEAGEALSLAKTMLEKYLYGV